jgi:hypothetical protein
MVCLGKRSDIIRNLATKISMSVILGTLTKQKLLKLPNRRGPTVTEFKTLGQSRILIMAQKLEPKVTVQALEALLCATGNHESKSIPISKSGSPKLPAFPKQRAKLVLENRMLVLLVD